MPFLFVCYLFAQVDRMNIAFAKLDMLDDLGFSEAVHGLGAGVFFIGYVLFEVPSNMLLRRYGAPLAGAHHGVLGIGAAGMMFVQTPMQFYIMRFLLGMAEAGSFRRHLHLTGWFTREHRGRMTAAFMTAIAVAGVVVGRFPARCCIISTNWAAMPAGNGLFLIEGVPSVLLGLATLYCLPVSPERPG